MDRTALHDQIEAAAAAAAAAGSSRPQPAESSGSCTPPNAGGTINIVELGHNSSELAFEAADRSIDMDRYREMLAADKQDCPLLAHLGYPVVLVSTTPGQKVIPQAQMMPVGNNPRNNRMATVAASRVLTGLATGCAIGNVYALRTDGKDLTAAEWGVLYDSLETLMDYYGDGPGSVGPQLLADVKKKTKAAMRQKGLLKAKDDEEGSGVHCWGCGVEGSKDLVLLSCSSCKQARYCSKDCQRADWKAGHKAVCKPKVKPAQAEADKVQRLLAAAVLKPEQIIKEHAAVADIAAAPKRRGYAEDQRQLAGVMPEDELTILMFNKYTTTKERLCVKCRTLYRLLDPAPDDQCAREQKLSGICSYKCWCALNPPSMSRYADPEWYGQEAMNPAAHGLTLRL